MAISAEELTEIDRALSNETPVVLSDLRNKFPHLSWTRCDASDVIEQPFRSYRDCDAHLLDGGDHCVEVTTEPSRATGVLLAFR